MAATSFRQLHTCHQNNTKTLEVFNKRFLLHREMLEQQGGRFLSIRILEDAMKAASLTNNRTTIGQPNASMFTF